MINISIITPTYNSQDTIETNINSICSQTFTPFEHIIIDGASTDSTIEKIKKLNPKANIYSESDDGIYDAMNKGINPATGDIIGILNSDDVYYDERI